MEISGELYLKQRIQKYQILLKNPISIKLNSTKLIHKEIDEKIKKL